MATCNICGEEIVFRHVGGRLVPLHTQGGWCSGLKADGLGHRPFRDIDSYVNPNAKCPVCGAHVFFYQSKYGGRVFFDALGWPWPKHPCTDNKIAQSKAVASLSPSRLSTAFRNRRDQTLNIFEIADLNQDEHRLRARFRKLASGNEFRASISAKLLAEHDIRIEDFWDAPSFIVKKEDANANFPVVEFICARKKKVVAIRMRRDRTR